MSNKIGQSLQSKKDEKINENPNGEKENRFLQDIQLLSSLKPIPGKIIPLYNKINEVPKINNKENNIDKSNKNETNNKIYHKSKSIFNPIEKPIINNYNNIINNNYTTNNYFFNNGINNTNININFNSIYNQPVGMIPLPDQFGFIDNPLLYPPSNHPSFLSIKSDMKNNMMPTENKYTQNSFYLQNMIFNGNYGNQNDNNINKGGNMNNNFNNKFSQLSYPQYNLAKEDFIKKNSSTNLLFKKDSENILENNINFINNNLFNNNTDKKNTLLLLNKNEENLKKEKKNIKKINKEKEKLLKEEKGQNAENDEKIKKVEKSINKKILFNIENYSEESFEEDDNIYHNINNNKLENNNLFNCFLKKKKKRKKIHDLKKFKCIHPTCNYSYKTLKQLQNHHYKMISECQIDSIHILKLIYNTKIILLTLIGKDKIKKDKFKKLYEDSANNITLSNYFESITGLNIDDII